MVEQDHSSEHRNGQGAVVAIGWHDHAEEGQVGSATEDGMHLVAENATFPARWPTPRRVGVVVVPSGQQTAVDDQVLTLEQPHSEQGSHHGEEDQDVGQQAQGPQTTRILRQADGASLTRFVELVVSQ